MTRRPSRLWAIGAVAAAVAAGGPAAGQPPPADKYKLDADRFIFRRVENDAPIRGEDRNRAEFDAYNEVVLFARRFPHAELAAAARSDLTFRDLLSEPGQAFRYDLVRFDGRLARLTDIKPTKPLAAAGVGHLYEGWVFPAGGSDPLVVLVTDLPAGLAPAADYSPPRPVTAAGYFFKVVRYEAVERHPQDPARGRVRRAPLLIGRSLTAHPRPAGPSGGAELAAGLLGLVAAVAAAVVGLIVLNRSGDRPHRRQSAARRAVNPFDDGGPPAAPPA